jgi:hypothetical protein
MGLSSSVCRKDGVCDRMIAMDLSSSVCRKDGVCDRMIAWICHHLSVERMVSAILYKWLFSWWFYYCYLCEDNKLVNIKTQGNTFYLMLRKMSKYSGTCLIWHQGTREMCQIVQDVRTCLIWHQGTREMCQIVQDVRTCLIWHQGTREMFQIVQDVRTCPIWHQGTREMCQIVQHTGCQNLSNLTPRDQGNVSDCTAHRMSEPV